MYVCMCAMYTKKCILLYRKNYIAKQKSSRKSYTSVSSIKLKSLTVWVSQQSVENS